ncbi:MAG: hypothetical protein PGN34_25995 [Methylobacterium frigidaeris]
MVSKTVTLSLSPILSAGPSLASAGGTPSAAARTSAPSLRHAAPGRSRFSHREAIPQGPPEAINRKPCDAVISLLPLHD